MNHKIVVEYPAGTYKSFVYDNEPGSEDYPLKGVIYPTSYGYIEGYIGEDGDELDVFVGTGDISGYIKVWRYDVPIETKIIKDVTGEEYSQIIEAFTPVLKEQSQFKTQEEFDSYIQTHRIT